MYTTAIINDSYRGYIYLSCTVMSTCGVDSWITTFPVSGIKILFSIPNGFLDSVVIPFTTDQTSFSIDNFLSKYIWLIIIVAKYSVATYRITEVKDGSDGIIKGLPLTDVYFDRFVCTFIVDDHT